MTLAPADQRRRPAVLPDVPFPGLRVFSAEFAPFFFGRDADRKVIVSNLEAARLTLLYGASGVGKSSVLQAGVVHTLRRRTLESLEVARRRNEERDVDKPQVAKFAVAEFHSWIDDPLPQLLERTRLAAMEALGGESLAPWEPGADVIATLRSWTKRVRFLYLLLDQFEEYFLYHPPSSDPGSFDVELARLVNEPGLHVHVLLSLREDALALLDRFKPTIPQLYDNYLRIAHLDLDAAEQAIRGPVAEYNALCGGEYSVDDQLVHELLASPELRTHRALGSGAVSVPAAQDGARPRIETPYLQLVLNRLWEAEQQANSLRLRAATLDALGGPRQIVKAHFDEAMSALTDTEQETAVDIFHHLVTPSKSKIAHSVDDLADYTGLPADDIAAVLRKLCADNDNRILNRTIAPADPEDPKPEERRARYEIWHDVLAEPILVWREKKLAERHEREKRKAKELAARQRMRRLLVIGACILAAVVAAGLVVSLVFNVRASSAQQKSRSQQLAAQALVEAGVYPSAGLGKALHALRVRSTPAAMSALLTILPELRLRAIVRSRGRATVALLGGPNGRDVVLVNREGRKDVVRIWKWRANKEFVRLEPPGIVTSAKVANAGKLLFTSSKKTSTAKAVRMRLWDISTCKKGQSCSSHSWTGVVKHPSISDDGRWVVDNKGGRHVQLRKVNASRSIDLSGTADVTHVAVEGVPHGHAAVVAATEAGGTVVVWSRGPRGYRRVHQINTPWASVNGVAVSRNGKLVAAFGDMAADVWDLEKCASGCEPVLEARTPGWMQAIAFAPDNASLATASEDGVARIWNLLHPTAPLELPGLQGVTFSIGFDPRGRYLIAGARHDARVWDLGGDRVVARAGTSITSAAYAPDGKRIAVGTATGGLTVRNKSGRILTRLRLPSARDRHSSISAVFTRTGTLFAGLSNGAAVRWDLRRCRSDVCTGSPAASQDVSGGLAVNSDGTLLAGEDGSHHEVRLMNARTGHVVATMNRYDKYGRIESLAFSPHAPLLAIASAGGSAKNSIEGVISIWKVAQCTRGKRCTPRRKRVLAVSKPVLSVAFSPDGSLIAAGSSDGVGRVWHWRDRPVPKPFELTGDAISSIGAIAFSADGHRIATSAADTTIRIWDAQQGHLLGVLRSHTDLVNTVQFDPHDSSKVLSASNDGTATISTCKNMCASVDVARALAESRQHEARQPPSWLPDDRP